MTLESLKIHTEGDRHPAPELARAGARAACNHPGHHVKAMTTPVAANKIPSPPALPAGRAPESGSPHHPDKREPPTGTEKHQKSRLNADISQLTADERTMVEKLKARDREVRAHEMAHITAGAHHITSGARFAYQTGPDGRRYRIGGEVSLDVSKIAGSPEKTAAKMQTIQNAALAPVNPSATDRAVAAKASRMEMQARIETYKALTELKEHQETLPTEQKDPVTEPLHPTGNTINIKL